MTLGQKLQRLVYFNSKYWTYQSWLSHISRRISTCHLSEWRMSGDIWKWQNVLGEDTTLQALTKQRKANVQYYALLALSQKRTCFQDGRMSPRIDSKHFSMVTSIKQNDEYNNRYLYAIFLALDANFRLKRKNVSSNEADPGLSKGWAYIVEETKYKAHLELHKNEVEPVWIQPFKVFNPAGGGLNSLQKSTCSRHDAVNLADSKPNRGYAASGGGTVDCSCHDMKRPNSFGDLQKGER